MVDLDERRERLSTGTSCRFRTLSFSHRVSLPVAASCLRPKGLSLEPVTHRLRTESLCNACPAAAFSGSVFAAQQRYSSHATLVLVIFQADFSTDAANSVLIS
jgi:hypothetical protein